MIDRPSRLYVVLPLLVCSLELSSQVRLIENQAASVADEISEDDLQSSSQLLPENARANPSKPSPAQEVYPRKGNPDGFTKVQPDTRYAIEFLVERWKRGEEKPLNDILKGFREIQKLPTSDPNSFAHIAGIHGRPYVLVESETLGDHWEGYCHHNNVLFPVWHRAYLWYLEQALQTVLGDTTVRMAYWDEIGDDTRRKGVPEIFTADLVWIDGNAEKNPLKDFTFDKDYLYSKPQDTGSRKYPNMDYTTMRHPLYRAQAGKYTKEGAEDHNQKYPDGKATEQLNTNVKEWIFGLQNGQLGLTTKQEYEECLNVEEYTYFSNRKSANNYEKTQGTACPLEQPHNGVHRAIGGDSPPGKIPRIESNGDMAWPDRTAFDPIFFFHHCYVDLVFWKWQQVHNDETLAIADNEPGTFFPVDGDPQPSPGLKPGDRLTMETPLYPFKHASNSSDVIGKDVTNTGALGYTYDERTVLVAATREPEGPLPELSVALPGTAESAIHVVTEKRTSRDRIRVWNVDVSVFCGPFTIVVFIKTPEGATFVGKRNVLDFNTAQPTEDQPEHRYMEFWFSLQSVDPNVVFDQTAIIGVRFYGALFLGQEPPTYQAEFSF